ncbi:hypothetical protein NUACC21_25360 [Scytonema sp. NUACC21]
MYILILLYINFYIKQPKGNKKHVKRKFKGQTEIRLLKARKTPNGVAARAIMRSGSGHKGANKATIVNRCKCCSISLLLSSKCFYTSPQKTLGEQPDCDRTFGVVLTVNF